MTLWRTILHCYFQLFLPQSRYSRVSIPISKGKWYYELFLQGAAPFILHCKAAAIPISIIYTTTQGAYAVNGGEMEIATHRNTDAVEYELNLSQSTFSRVTSTATSRVHQLLLLLSTNASHNLVCILWFICGPNSEFHHLFFHQFIKTCDILVAIHTWNTPHKNSIN